MDLDLAIDGDPGRFERRYELRRHLWLDGPCEGRLGFDRLLGRVVEVHVEYEWTRPLGGHRRRIALLATLDHPSIPPIFDAGLTVDGRLFSVTRLRGGDTLGEHLRGHARGEDSGLRGFADSVEALLPACGALAHAHSRGVLHLGVMPNEIYLGAGPGEIVLDGWDQAIRLGEAMDSDDGWGRILGAPAYIAPEQITGPRADLTPRTDVHGVGAVLYHVLYEMPPNPGPGIMRRVEQAAARKRPGTFRRERLPESLRSSRRALRLVRDLEAICLRALEVCPGDRPPGVTALRDELRDWLAEFRSLAARLASPSRWWPRSRRRTAPIPSSNTNGGLPR